MLQNVEENISPKDANLRNFGKLPGYHAQQNRAKDNQALEVVDKADQQNFQNQSEEPNVPQTEVSKSKKQLTYKVQKRPYVPPKFIVREKSELPNLTPHWTNKGVQLFEGPENITKDGLYNTEPFPKGYTVDMKLKSMNIPSNLQHQRGPYIPPVFFKPSRSQNQKQNMLISINDTVPPSLQQWTKKIEKDCVQFEDSEVNQVIKRKKKSKPTNQIPTEKYLTTVPHANKEKTKTDKIPKSDKMSKSEKIFKSLKTPSNQLNHVKTHFVRNLGTNQSEIFKNKLPKRVPKSELTKYSPKRNQDHKVSVENLSNKAGQETFVEENAVQNYVKEHFLSTYRNSKSYNIPKPPHLSEVKVKQAKASSNKPTLPGTTASYKLRVKPPLKSVFYKPISPKKEKPMKVKEKIPNQALDALNYPTENISWSFIEPQIPKFLSPAINDLKVRDDIQEEDPSVSENLQKEKKNKNSINQDNSRKSVSKAYQDLKEEIDVDSPQQYIKRIESRYSIENNPDTVNQNNTFRENYTQQNTKVISHDKHTTNSDQLIKNKTKLDQKKENEGTQNVRNIFDVPRTASHEILDIKRNYFKQNEEDINRHHSEMDLKRDHSTFYAQRSLSKHIINKPKQDGEQENANDWVSDAAAYSNEIQKSPGTNFKRQNFQRKNPRYGEFSKSAQAKSTVSKDEFNHKDYWKLSEVMTEIEDDESPLDINEEDFKVYLSIPADNQYCGFRICNSHPFKRQMADL